MLILAFLIWLCTLTLHISAVLLNILSVLLVLVSISSFIDHNVKNGVIELAAAFVLSPYGLPMLGAWLVVQLHLLRDWMKDGGDRRTENAHHQLCKTRDIYTAYRKAGYSRKYYDAHESDIIIHKAAKKAFDELALKKLPTVKSLQAEYSDLLVQKKLDYAELSKARDEAKRLHIIFCAGQNISG